MLKFDRRLISHFDWGLLILTTCLIAAGLATVLSATYVDGRILSPLALRQLIWALIGFGGLFAAVSFDYRQLERHAYLIYGLALCLLILVPVAGSISGGSRRWISLGPVSLQPSELAKLALVIALARYLHPRLGEQSLPLRAALIPAVLVAVPAVLVLAQPDLGTALLLGFCFVALLLIAGMRLRWFLLGIALVAPLVPPIWGHLKPYQQQRILTFVDPQADPLGAGYHVIQSQIAIGSGMGAGKGYLQGTQNHLNFLPEQHTDFIFSVFAEEWGFAGGCVLLSIYAGLVIRCFLVALRAKDTFGLLLAFGLGTMLCIQAVINIGMASGVLPVVGVTLPLFSYGGSSLLTMMIGLGLVINVSMRRFTF